MSIHVWRIVLLIRFWHPELPAERWRDTLDAGMTDFAAMLRLRVSPPANAAVAEAWRRPPRDGRKVVPAMFGRIYNYIFLLLLIIIIIIMYISP